MHIHIFCSSTSSLFFPNPNSFPSYSKGKLKMLGINKFISVKKLAKKAKAITTSTSTHDQYFLIKDNKIEEELSLGSPNSSTPTGNLAIYVGEERERFIVPTSYLSHPLFKILLEKTYNEFGFDQTGGLVVPCSVNAFQEVVNAVECCNGKFDFGELVEEFL
ncbi:putative small nuclear ribonucleoprotein G-like [Capsicum annuum]|uniref:auxin-responsive protein SAUR71 n=1 Tax=Capsicum annuum TaxID=4072 RepID=UPI001FB0F50A|nr:auxin-responsive protein SAUR71 [Capsicum annuum]KAF3645278.1 putative small nuclear ribonucleoprotein G-like [Capsicum annuum]